MKFYRIFILSCLFIFSKALMAEPGVVVLGGGGPEGDIGVTTDWSYPLYKKLIDNGDTTGDKKIKVVVLSLEKPDTNFIVDYFKSMGADSSYNLVVSSRKEANDPKVVAMMKDADVVFIRGGNQGKAYQLWKGTKVQEQIKALGDRGGAIGGTSSGAMGLSQYSITGGKDFATKDVLKDSHSPLLNDEVDPKTSGIHNDFLNAAPGILADTHCGERGRVGRLLATMAKAIDDFKDKKIVSVCIEEKTGIAIIKGKAQVFGTGSVHFLSETPETKKERLPGKPLSYINVRDDALTEGWTYDLSSRTPDLKNLPKSAKASYPDINCGQVTDQLKIKSNTVNRITFIEPPFSNGLVIAEDAYSDSQLMSRDKKRGVMQTLSFNRLAKNPNGSVVFLDSSSEIDGLGKNTIAVKSQKNGREAMPSLILDCQYCSYTSTSSFVSTQDQGDQTLHSSGFVNMRIHVIGDNDTYNVRTHKATLARDYAVKQTGTVECKGISLSEEMIDQLVSDQLNVLRKLNCAHSK
ncbi:MAG: cyanophycinase [Rhizobacter sp.]|nr:cyanophycinase [Bacteriovorax sp.]